MKKNQTLVLQSFLEKMLRRSPNLEEITGLMTFWNDKNQENKTEALRLLGQFASLQRISFAGCEMKREEIAHFSATSGESICEYAETSGFFSYHFRR